MALTDVELEQIVGDLLDEFYRRRIQKLDKLELKDALKRKNPYLFRAVGFQKAGDIVEALLQAYMSSSDEGIFGDAFFEPLAKRVSGGTVAAAEGIDVMIEDERRILAVAVKSGPAVFNAQSKRRQDQEFKSLRSRLFKTQRQFDALVGYCYGKKVAAPSGERIFREASGQALWQELTGAETFYLRILRVMRDRPLQHKVTFDEAWAAAVNRFTAAFISEFCHADGSINWEALLTFNSGTRVRQQKL